VPAEFVVVDAQGSVVDLAALVSAGARAIADEDPSGDVEAFDIAQSVEGLSVQVRGVRVCTGFQVPASSHTGRDLETETEGARG
jgi:hypothetical protein